MAQPATLRLHTQSGIQSFTAQAGEVNKFLVPPNGRIELAGGGRLQVRRKGNDLIVQVDDLANGQPTSGSTYILLQDFYPQAGCQLAGVDAQGNPVEYLPSDAGGGRSLGLLGEDESLELAPTGQPIDVTAPPGICPRPDFSATNERSNWLKGAAALGLAIVLSDRGPAAEPAVPAPTPLLSAPLTAPSSYADNAGGLQSPASTAGLTDDSTPALNIGALPAGASGAVLYVDGVLRPATYNPATGTLTPDAPLGDGAHLLGYGWLNPAGASGSSPTLKVTVDATAPAVTTYHYGTGLGWQLATFTFTATASTATFQIREAAGSNAGGYILMDTAATGQSDDLVPHGASNVNQAPTVAQLFGGAAASDPDSGGSIKGYAITGAAAETGDATPGHWQYYNTATSSWTNLDTASTVQAVFLESQTKIRWNDDDIYHTALSGVAVDNTSAAVTGGVIDVSTRGASEPYSSAVASLTANADPLASKTVAVTGIGTDTGASASDLITSDATLVFTGTSNADDGTSVSVRLAGVHIGYATVNAGIWSYDYSGTVLAAGTYTLSADLVDAAHRVVVSSPALTIAVDTVAPTLMVDASNGGKISGTAEAGAQIEIDANGDNFIDYTATAGSTGAWAVSSAPLVVSGTPVSVKARDVAGNLTTVAVTPGFAPVVDLDSRAIHANGVFNGDFSAGDSGWTFTTMGPTAHGVSGGVLRLETGGVAVGRTSTATSQVIENVEPFSQLTLDVGVLAMAGPEQANETRVSFGGVLYATIVSSPVGSTVASVTYANGASGNLTSLVRQSAGTGPTAHWVINLPADVASSGSVLFTQVNTSGGTADDDTFIDNVQLLTRSSVAPEPGLDYTVGYASGAPAVSVSSSAHLSDANSTTLQGAMVTLTNPFAGDRLLVDGSPAASGTLANGIHWATSGAAVTLTGPGTLAQYEEAIRLVQFDSASANTTTRELHVSVNDGVSDSNSAVTLVLYAPSSYVDNAGAVQETASTAARTDDMTPGIRVGALPTGISAVLLYVDNTLTAATYDAATGTLTPDNLVAEGAHRFTYAYQDVAGYIGDASPGLVLALDYNLVVNGDFSSTSGWAVADSAAFFIPTGGSTLAGQPFPGNLNGAGELQIHTDTTSGTHLSSLIAARNENAVQLVAGTQYVFSFDAHSMLSGSVGAGANGRWVLLDASTNAIVSELTDWFTTGGSGAIAGAVLLGTTYQNYIHNVTVTSSGTYKIGLDWNTPDINAAYEMAFDRIYLGESSTALLPIALDLNQDGQVSYSHVSLDVHGDGTLLNTAWTASQDGVLVWDKHGDATVHNSSQYAFAQYGGTGATDLSGLAFKFDTNQDGLFDVTDELFSQFAVWQDINQNGVSETGELKTLTALADGSHMLVADVAFSYTPLIEQSHAVI